MSESENLHKFTVELYNQEQWYEIIREANQWFGKDWRGQRNVLKKFVRKTAPIPLSVWFEVPDPKFASWVTLKCAQNKPKKQT